MADCSKNLYTVNFTDKNKDHISVSKGELITDKADIAFVGKTKKDYGEIFNENVLHLLEHFACPEDPLNAGNPDLATAFGALLENPIEGQIWFNTTDKRPYRYDGSEWAGLGTGCDIAGNYGVISHGEQLPQPVCPITNYVFSYDECSWIVSPFNYPDEIDFMECYTDDSGIVTIRYRLIGGSLVDGSANYQIVGIKDNNNIGTIGPPPSPPAISPTPAVTQTPAPTITPTPTEGSPPTVTPTQTVTPTVTPTNTQTPTPTQTVTPTVTPTESNDPQGDVIEAIYSCTRLNSTSCITIGSSGLVSASGCESGGFSSSWVLGGFRAGESGADYSFNMVNLGPDTVTGPTSGTFSSPKSWCVSLPPSPFGDNDDQATIEVTITGPAGTNGGVITLNIRSINQQGF